MRRIQIQRTYIEGKPRISTADENLEVRPFRVVSTEISKGSLGGSDTLDPIGVNCGPVVGLEDVLDISGSLLDVTLDIHGETGRLGDGKTEVKSDNTGYTTKTDEQTPHGVNMVKNGRVIV